MTKKKKNDFETKTIEVIVNKLLLLQSDQTLIFVNDWKTSFSSLPTTNHRLHTFLFSSSRPSIASFENSGAIGVLPKHKRLESWKRRKRRRQRLSNFGEVSKQICCASCGTCVEQRHWRITYSSTSKDLSKYE